MTQPNLNLNNTQSLENANEFLATLLVIMCICIGIIALVSILLKKEKITIYITNIVFDIIIFIKIFLTPMDGSSLNSNLINTFVIIQWIITLLISKIKFKNEKNKIIIK